MALGICGDCACQEGELHDFGCDQEKCPNCGGQLLSCGCFDEETIEEIPNREPFFTETSTCARCGKISFGGLMVDSETWRNICGLTYNKEDILCNDCMEFIMKKRNIEPKWKNNYLDKFKGGEE